jgi:NAD(P)-dependent dehydrogenase (short-subunit alcohol dehydrogenase family)
MVRRIIAPFMDASRPLSGKTAIVTGAGSGIGQAIASELAAQGANVELVGRRAERLRETQSQIGATARVGLHAVDITDGEALARMVKAVAAARQHIHILVNAAGVSAVTDPDNADRREFAQIIDTNLIAPFDLIRLALPHMPDGGRVVNIASVLGLRAARGSSAYCASKHGLIGLTRALALDLAPRRITVNAVCPGWVDTDMSRDIISAIARQQNQSELETRRTIEADIPMVRMVERGEVAQLAAHLCGPAASAITGQAIAICGGSSIS